MVQTPLTETQLLGALRDGHVAVFGTAPSENRLAMAWGQVAFENGGGKLTYNNNLGNVVAANRETPHYYCRSDHHRYRAFETPAEGAAAYWEVIKRCKAALVRFDQGNPYAAAAGLKQCNYFEADLGLYTRGFSQLYYHAKKAVFTEEERERREYQEKLDAVHSELVNLIVAAEAARSAPAIPSDD
jgi:hypothetical protein